MIDRFVLQGMEKFTFEVSEPYSVPHSLIFSLIAARCRAVDLEESCDRLLFTDEREFRSMADEFQQLYLFPPSPFSLIGIVAMVKDYLHQYPDKQIDEFVKFASLPGNQSHLEFFGNINPSSAKKKDANVGVKMRRKQMAAKSKRKNRK